MEFVDLAALTIHDVKNRLTLLASRADAQGDAATLHDALEAASTLTRLLAYYKSERGQLALDIDAHVPADLLDELAAEIRRQTALTVAVDCSAAPTLWFYDAGLIRMVLLSALYNALRHARSRVSLVAEEQPTHLEFRVHDDGPGFPDAVLAESTAMQAVTRHGTGLGLHLASRVAALHANAGQAGGIELRNDNGAVFCLRLPR